MRIYTRLFYNNIESFCGASFKRAKAVLGNEPWHELIRDFVHRHVSSSPFFCEIQDEFLEFLVTECKDHDLPPFLVELCHYEWHQLHLLLAPSDISERILREVSEDTQLVLSPLAYNLVYDWQVHKIDEKNIPIEKPKSRTHLIVYRNAEHKINHIESKVNIARLLDCLKECQTAATALGEFLATSFPHVSKDQIEPLYEEAYAALRELAQREIVVAGLK